MIQKIIFARDYGDNNGNDLTIQSSFATLQASFDLGISWQNMSKNGAGLYSTSDFYHATSGIDWSVINASGFAGDFWLRENLASTIEKYKYKAFNYLAQPIDGITFIAKKNGTNIDLIIQSQADNVGQNNGQTQLNNANSDYASTVPSPIIQWYFNNQTPVVDSYSFVVNGGTPRVISFDRNLFPDTQTATPSILTTVINPSTASISGSSEANAAVEAFKGTTSIGTATANGSGAYTISISGQIVGDAITVKATASGKTVSLASNSISVTAVVVTQTTQPTISIGSITTGTLAIPGSAEANATVQAFNGSNSIGTATANASGIYSITIVSQAVGGVITVKATASGKTVSNASSPLTVIATTSPQTAIPVIANTVLYSTSTTLNGTAENNSTVKIKNGNVELATATANATGLWNATFVAQPTGASVTATATASGKTESNASAAIVVLAAVVIVNNPVTNQPITGNTPVVIEPIVSPGKPKESKIAWIIGSIVLAVIGLLWFALKGVKWAFTLVLAGIVSVFYFVSSGENTEK